MLFAGRDVVLRKRTEGDDHLGRELREARNPAAQLNGNVLEGSHFENFAPKNGTLFRASGNVKQKQHFGNFMRNLRCDVLFRNFPLDSQFLSA